MQVLLLLDQDVRPLVVHPLAGKGTKPVEIMSVGGIPSDVEKSFYGAALATYSFLVKNGDKIPNSIFVYEMEEEVARRIYGGSGALAFAVASMCEMLGRKCGKTVGATGVVDTEKGTVGKVGAINEKLSIVIQRTPEVSLVLYPLQNASEVAPEMKRQAKEKGIELKPVRTLDEVHRALFGRAKKSRPRVLASTLIILTMYLTYAFSSHGLAAYLLENEHYSFARWHLRIARSVAFYNSDLQSVSKAFDAPLQTQPLFSLRFLSGREETYPVDRVPPEFRLSERDTFAFRVDPMEPLYVYIVQSEGPGSFRVLYPSDSHATPLYTPTTIPGPGVFFRLQGKAGNKDIYMVLSKWRCRVLEKALSSYGQDFRFPDNMNKYLLEEQCIQLKRLSVSLDK